MTKEEKISYFKTELGYIKTESYKEDFNYLISNLPDYFLKLKHLQPESITQDMR